MATPLILPDKLAMKVTYEVAGHQPIVVSGTLCRTKTNCWFEPDSNSITSDSLLQFSSEAIEAIGVTRNISQQCFEIATLRFRAAALGVNLGDPGHQP